MKDISLYASPTKRHPYKLLNIQTINRDVDFSRKQLNPSKNTKLPNNHNKKRLRHKLTQGLTYRKFEPTNKPTNTSIEIGLSNRMIDWLILTPRQNINDSLTYS